MEDLLILAAVVALAIPVAIVWLIVAVSGLKTRVRQLEARVGAGALHGRAAMPYTPPLADPVPEPLAEEVAASVRPAAGNAVAETEPPAMDTPPAEPPPIPPSAIPSPAIPGPAVLSGARASALGDWLKVNWIYAVSALSLAFAGVFFVQYGVENGLLPPAARVAMALLFGAALIAAGEVIRRRSGDGARVSTAYLPSTFSGAGIVSIFAGILAARQLYGLIGVEVAFAGLVATAGLAVLLGWFYGPFLAAVGLVGAGVVPFIVGGSSDSANGLYAYFALIAAAGLAVDAVRRWAWVSVLALAVGYAGMGIVLMASGGAGWFAVGMAGLALLALLVPCLRLAPDHQGTLVGEWLWRRGTAEWPQFPTRLAAGAVLASSAALALTATVSPAESLMAFLALAVLCGALILWSREAPALSDLAALPAVAWLCRVVAEGTGYGPLAADFLDHSIALRAPETAAPATAGLLLGGATLLTVLAAWRSGQGAWRAVWAAGAALLAPLTAVALELVWRPSDVIGAYPWALHVIALAAVMTFLAVRFARADAPDMRRAAYMVLSVLSLIALALFLVMTKGALTLALAALVVVAALLDRRFRLPEMGWFVQAAVVGLSYRLVVDPGLPWAVEGAALWEVLAAYGGTVLAMIAALRLMAGEERRSPQVFLESGAAASAALLANVLITRWLTQGSTDDWLISHWGASLNAMPWLILMLVQLYRLSLGGALRWFRIALAVVAGLIAAAGIGAAVGPLNPLAGLTGGREGLVHGPYLFDTLLAAYGLPAVLILAAVPWLKALRRQARLALAAIGLALAALWLALEIRRFWRGDDLSVPGVSQPELYSYTIALLILGAVLLYQAIARRSVDLRRAAMAVIALTVAKVFLLDAAGLSGLTRVASFVGLGLALAGIAWLNRWAAARQEDAV